MKEENNIGFVPFKTRFSKLADKNSIGFTVLNNNAGLPSGTYAAEPSFCLEIADGCDCRKTILNVYDENKKHLASVHYGWENPGYYLREFSEIPQADKMAGFYLEPLCEQSQHAPALLFELERAYSNDQRYRKVVEAEYNIWRQSLTGENLAEINDVETAHSLIHQQLYGIPYNAIQFLRRQPDTPELIGQIVFAIEHAYDGTFHDKYFDWYHAAPLWYAVVAETHLTEDLIDPILRLFAEDAGDDWDFLSEQGERLLGLLVDKFPRLVIAETKKFLEKILEGNVKAPYLYTSVVFEHEAASTEVLWLLKFIQHPNNRWKGYYADFLLQQGITEAIPILKDMLPLAENQWEQREIEYAIEELQKLEGVHGSVKSKRFPTKEKNYDWEKHYKEFEERFYPDEEDEDSGEDDKPPEQVGRKIGRNEPCPCGAKKPDGTPIKYKKCHGK